MKKAIYLALLLGVYVLTVVTSFIVAVVLSVLTNGFFSVGALSITGVAMGMTAGYALARRR